MKHPGIPDQTKKKRSLAEMAAIRASEKAANDAKVAMDLTAPFIIADIEDSTAAADKDDKENAAHPVPENIPCVFHPTCRISTFTNLEQDDDVEEAHEGQSSVISASPLLNTGKQ